MDIFSKSERSEIMSKVLAKNNKLEISVRKYLFSKGFRYRKNVEDMPGKPDIVLPKYKTIIFIHGCFWHGHENCDAATLPTSNIEYWTNKVKSNVNRDLRNKQLLINSGWKIIIVWECELKSKNKEQRFSRLLLEIRNSSNHKS
jgi:DNA mismatch endonuclease, patch repair protein